MTFYSSKEQEFQLLLKENGWKCTIGQSQHVRKGIAAISLPFWSWNGNIRFSSTEGQDFQIEKECMYSIAKSTCSKGGVAAISLAVCSWNGKIRFYSIGFKQGTRFSAIENECLISSFLSWKHHQERSKRFKLQVSFHILLRTEIGIDPIQNLLTFSIGTTVGGGQGSTPSLRGAGLRDSAPYIS